MDDVLVAAMRFQQRVTYRGSHLGSEQVPENLEDERALYVGHRMSVYSGVTVVDGECAKGSSAVGLCGVTSILLFGLYRRIASVNTERAFSGLVHKEYKIH